MIVAKNVPEYRKRSLNQKPLMPSGNYILYWMTSARRTRHHYGLELAIEYANKFKKPLVVFEPLRQGYPWASLRFHRFIVEGMIDNERAFSNSTVFYYPYIEAKEDDGKGLLQSLSKDACIVIADDAPFFFLPKMLERAGDLVSCACIAVDSNGIYPFRHATRAFTTAASFRRHLQKNLPDYLGEMSSPEPLEKLKKLPRAKIQQKILKKWPLAQLNSQSYDLFGTHFDRSVKNGVFKGGQDAAVELLNVFVDEKLQNYCDKRNQPDEKCQSFLSPYLHFGHISSQHIFAKLIQKEDWSPLDLAPKSSGSRYGWWGMSEAAESFLDQFITWRELGYNGAAMIPNYDTFGSLPAWAQKTLEYHADDPRDFVYSEEQFEKGQTHDRLWNAAQLQLVNEGTIHNYLRMLWGKKILEWTAHPSDALRIMVQLNNKYAFDGRNPNSYSGIFWTLGRYDRAWGPERPVFGKIRFMSSANTARKIKIKKYVETYSILN